MTMIKRKPGITVYAIADRIQEKVALPFTGIPYDIGYQISELTVWLGRDFIMNKRIGFDLQNSGDWHKSWYESCDLFVGIADTLWEE